MYELPASSHLRFRQEPELQKQGVCIGASIVPLIALLFEQIEAVLNWVHDVLETQVFFHEQILFPSQLIYF